MEILRAHHWPGNIRELQNFVERSSIVTQGRVLSPRITELNLLMHSAVPAPVQTPGVWQFPCLVYVMADAVIPTETEQFSWIASWRAWFI